MPASLPSDPPLFSLFPIRLRPPSPSNPYFLPSRSAGSGHTFTAKRAERQGGERPASVCAHPPHIWLVCESDCGFYRSVLAKSKMLRMHSGFIPEESFRMRKKFLIDKHLSQGSSPRLCLREHLPAKALPLLPVAAATLPSSVPSMVLLLLCLPLYLPWCCSGSIGTPAMSTLLTSAE